MVYKPYTEIQKLIGDKQFAEAMVKIEALAALKIKLTTKSFSLVEPKLWLLQILAITRSWQNVLRR